MNDLKKVKVTCCEGEGQGSCKRYVDKGIWNRMWMSFLYKIEGLEGCYCAKCVVEISEEQLKELGLVEEQRTGYERVKKGETYYIVDIADNAMEVTEYKDQYDTQSYNTGNYYNDKAIAENNARADRLLRQLRQWQAANDKTISISDWKNEGIIKYFIAYNYRSSLFEIGRCSRRREPNIIYFTTKDKVSKAVKNFRDELEWYFTEYQKRLDEE